VKAIVFELILPKTIMLLQEPKTDVWDSRSDRTLAGKESSIQVSPNPGPAPYSTPLGRSPHPLSLLAILAPEDMECLHTDMVIIPHTPNQIAYASEL
jgi:hypothetical protein